MTVFDFLTQHSQSRIRAAAANRPSPAKPTNFFTSSVSTITAISREASYLQFTPSSVSAFFIIPPLGSVIIILLYFGFILALEFINNNYPGAQHDEALGLRAGWLAIAQVPLLVLLSGKVNIIGIITGVSYERLNVYHRWVARGLLMLASMHFGFQSRGWSNYGLMQLEWQTDSCTTTGIAAYALVLWMNLSTLPLFRRFSYKFFVIQHIIVFIGFIIAMMEHLPDTALYTRVYIWIPIGFYLFDRTARTVWYLWNNVSPAKARLQAVDSEAVKLRISNKRIKSWSPGAHFRLRFPRHGFWHTHPGTALSTPSSHGGDLVFVLRCRGWLTRQLLRRVEILQSAEAASDAVSEATCTTLISGPYRSSHNDFAAFDTLLSIAGGSGISFPLSALFNLARRASLQKLPLRTVHLVWVIRQTSWISLVAEELESIREQLGKAGIEVRIQVFVTSGTIPRKLDSTVEKGALDSTKEHAAAESPSHSSGGEAASDYLAAAHPGLPIEYHAGRPNVRNLMVPVIEKARGESAVAVCGPIGLVTSTRTAVASLSDERAVHKSTGAQGIYLHVENTEYS